MDTDTLNHWRETSKRSLTELAAIPYPENVDMTCKTVFDESADIYMAIVEGWEDVRRLHGIPVHVEIKE